MKNKEKFSIVIRLNNQRAKQGLLPIYIKVTVEGVRAEIGTRHFVDPSHWNAKLGKMNPGTPNEFLVNVYINDVIHQLNQHYLFLTASKAEITSKKLKNLYLGIEDEEKPKEKTITDAFEYHAVKMMDMVKIGRISPKTLIKFKITKNSD